jgi:hypothetical protein
MERVVFTGKKGTVANKTPIRFLLVTAKPAPLDLGSESEPFCEGAH